MVIGGLIKNSLIDYPGKVSCVLFLSGCNFDCPYCHNPNLVKDNLSRHTLFQEASFFDFIQTHKKLLDGVVISGGEPTLSADLPYFCERIKQAGYSIKLDTNGSRPKVIKELIDEGLVDYIAMDIKTDPSHYFPYITREALPENILSNIEIIMQSPLDYEFRTTCVKPFVDKQIIKKIAKTIRGARLYVLQRFRNNEILHPEFFQGHDIGYDEEGMMDLKSTAAQWVKNCRIR